jgi:hypothetical protein
MLNPIILVPMGAFEREKESLPTIHLYEDPSSKTLNLPEIVRYLQEKLGEIRVDVRKPLIATSSRNEAEVLARRIAEIKIRDPTSRWARSEPFPAEIEFEWKLLLNPTKRLTGILYDGVQLQLIALELLPRDELTLNNLHVVFTNRLFGTYEPDGRYHAHVSIYGFPSLISTTGIVEAPAKPKEFYELRQRYLALGDQVALERLKERFRERFIDYGDPRLTEVLKGYVMQAVFYHLGFDLFCTNRWCRLFNARWQEEVIEAQLSKPEFCELHAKALEKIRNRLHSRL